MSGEPAQVMERPTGANVTAGIAPFDMEAADLLADIGRMVENRRRTTILVSRLVDSVDERETAFRTGAAETETVLIRRNIDLETQLALERGERERMAERLREVEARRGGGWFFGLFGRRRQAALSAGAGR
jgi:hypothetical protein